MDSSGLPRAHAEQALAAVSFRFSSKRAFVARFSSTSPPLRSLRSLRSVGPLPAAAEAQRRYIARKPPVETSIALLREKIKQYINAMKQGSKRRDVQGIRWRYRMKRNVIFMLLLIPNIVFGEKLLLGNSIDVNSSPVVTAPTGTNSRPRIAADGQGNFVIVWQSHGIDGEGIGIFGQRFDSKGDKLFSEFQVNQRIERDQKSPDVDMHSDGTFAITWESRRQLGNVGSEIMGRAYDLSKPLTNEFRLSFQGDDGYKVDPKITTGLPNNAFQ